MGAEAPRALRVLMPRALLDPQLQSLPCGNAEGLLPVQLDVADGAIAAIHCLRAAPGQLLPLALSPLVDAHAHLDKAFSWASHPNRQGTMAAALAANLQEAEARTAEHVFQRGERALEQAWRYGLRAIRSHIDSGGSMAEPSWRALLELQQRWRGRVDLQLVALVPLSHWSSAAGQRLAARVAAAGGLLGGVLGPPMARSHQDRLHLHALLKQADQLGCGVDLHVDESDADPALGLRQLVAVLQQWRPSVPITCSHASSMGLMRLARQRRLAEQLAQLDVSVVALPTTNFWLLGRAGDHDISLRPLAPVRALQRAGVAVALAADNVQDPWFPGGDFDPLELLRFSSCVCHLSPWQRQGLQPFTTVPARLLGLSWDGIVRVGAPADLLVTNATSWGELLARSPQRRVLRGGIWLKPPASQQCDQRLASLGEHAAF